MRTFCFAALAAFALFRPPMVSAQPAAGQIGMYFDAAGTQAAQGVTAFDVVEAFVVVTVPDDLSGFELSIDAPPEVIVTGAIAYDQPALCISGCGPIDWALLGRSCVSGSLAIVTVQWMMTSLGAVDVPVCVAPPIENPQEAPRYRDCANEPRSLSLAPSPYGNPYAGCALANPTVLATGAERWSSLKASFER